MKIFISWSGLTSRAVAEALHDWLPRMIQALQPWLSSTDIEKGARWSTDIALQLEKTSFGLICLTKDNLESPWILFEAGALSKTLDRSYVCPYLLGLEPTDLKGPLVQFQSTKAEKEDTRQLIQTINRAQGTTALPENLIDDMFELLWPKLEHSLKNVPNPRPNQKRMRSERELLEEMLDLIRSQARKAIDVDKDPLYSLIKAEINDFKSYVLNTTMSKDAALQLEEGRLQQEIRECRLNLVRATVLMPIEDINEQVHPKLEETILRTKAKLHDLQSRAVIIKPEAQKEIGEMYSQISDLLKEFTAIKDKLRSGRNNSEDKRRSKRRRSRKSSVKKDA